MAPPAKDQPETRKRFSGGSILTWGAIALAGYFLSVGPVAMLFKSGRIPQAARPLLAGVFAPVDWLYDHTPLRRPLKWYVDLWTE